jgi:hypothetical protein
VVGRQAASEVRRCNRLVGTFGTQSVPRPRDRYGTRTSRAPGSAAPHNLHISCAHGHRDRPGGHQAKSRSPQTSSETTRQPAELGLPGHESADSPAAPSPGGPPEGRPWRLHASAPHRQAAFCCFRLLDPAIHSLSTPPTRATPPASAHRCAIARAAADASGHRQGCGRDSSEDSRHGRLDECASSGISGIC